MTTASFYVSADALRKGQLILTGPEHHHLSRVLRMRTGQPVRLLDGEGGVAQGTIREITSTHTVVVLDGMRRCEGERPRMHLFQALPQGAKMDLIVQASVELGAAVLVPFASSRSRALDDAVEKRAGRWAKIALESSRVAGRLYLPEVTGARTWSEALSGLGKMEVAVFADEAGGSRPADVLAGKEPGELGLVIGPEGGFSDGEREELIGSGIRPVTLGNNVLRAEAAGLVLMAAVRCHYGLL